MDAQTFSSPRAFLEQLPFDGPACVVLDLRMPELSGLDVQEQLALKGSPMPIVFFSGTRDVHQAAQAMRKGAADFLVKKLDDAALLDSVTRALAMAVEKYGRRREEDEQGRKLARLSPRERQVCDLVAKGLLNKEIASELGLSEKTVKVHRAHLMTKLQVDSVAALVWLLSRAPKPPPA
jgi:FixJ family two-component response regulator